MKVKARDVGVIGITPNKQYTVLAKRGTEFGVQYMINNDMDTWEYIHSSHFATVDDKPKIEVGSEWNPTSQPDPTVFVTVKYVGERKMFIKWTDGSEGERDIDTFLKTFTPKPKTVTMWFYKTETGYIMAKNSQPEYHRVLFTREIEL